MNSGPWVASAVTLSLTLIAGACRDSVAQAWRPAAGHTQIPIWPNGAPDARPGVGAEAAHTAVDRAGNPRLVGGRPRTYVENVTQPTITVYRPTGVNSGAAVLVFPGGG